MVVGGHHRSRRPAVGSYHCLLLCVHRQGQFSRTCVVFQGHGSQIIFESLALGLDTNAVGKYPPSKKLTSFIGQAVQAHQRMSFENTPNLI